MNGAEDIRDIRLPPPQPLRDFLLHHWPELAAAAVLLPAAILGFLWWRRRRAGTRVVPLLERTLAALEQARPLAQAGDAQAFSSRVSDIIRGYIEQRFRIHALQRTTLEFLRDCLAEPGSPLAAHRDELQQFLQLCDLAKFARWSPSGVEMESLLASARTFVQGTAAGP